MRSHTQQSAGSSHRLDFAEIYPLNSNIRSMWALLSVLCESPLPAGASWSNLSGSCFLNVKSVEFQRLLMQYIPKLMCFWNQSQRQTSKKRKTFITAWNLICGYNEALFYYYWGVLCGRVDGMFGEAVILHKQKCFLKSTKTSVTVGSNLMWVAAYQCYMLKGTILQLP